MKLNTNDNGEIHLTELSLVEYNTYLGEIEMTRKMLKGMGVTK